MSQQLLSPNAQNLERLLDAPGDNPAKRRISEVAILALHGHMPGTYDLFAVRKHTYAGTEIFRSGTVHVATYSEEDLYGKEGSMRVAFKAELRKLRLSASRIARLECGTLEYDHQSILFWADLGKLKSFLDVDPVITEIVAELRTARFQFLRQETPARVFTALITGLGLVIESPRWDSDMVDRFVEILEEGGIDPLAMNTAVGCDE